MKILRCGNCRKLFPDKWRKRPRCCCRECADEYRRNPPRENPVWCKVDGCEEVAQTFHGYCRRHYQQIYYQKRVVQGRSKVTDVEKRAIIRMFELQFKTRHQIALETGVAEWKVRDVIKARR